MATVNRGLRPTRKRLGIAASACAAMVGLAACGSSSSSKTAPATSATSGPAASATTAPAASTASSSSSPGTMFSAANVPGVGTVLVDGRGRTVYLLMSGGKNVPCDDASGCTKVWPDLPLPHGTSAATAGAGLQASLLSTTKLSDGETYPTYNGWLMYEYVGDSGAGQAHGQGIQSFGGTWYALSPSGMPVTSTAASTAGSGSGGGGY